MLWPDIIKELKTQLLAEAKECVLKLCSQKLYNWLKVGFAEMNYQFSVVFSYLLMYLFIFTYIGSLLQRRFRRRRRRLGYS